MKNKKNSKGNIYFYLQWPLVIAVFEIVITFFICTMSEHALAILIFNIIILIIFSIFLMIKNYRNFKLSLFNFAENQVSILHNFVKNTSVPVCVVNEEGITVWANDSFLSLDESLHVGIDIKKVFSDVSFDFLENLNGEKVSILSSFKDKQYKIHMSTFDAQNLGIENNIFNDNEKYIYLFIEDETEFYQIRQNYEDEKTVIGMIYIDNYDEVTENIEDSKATMLIAMVDRKLSRYISNNSGIIKKLEKDKYLFCTNKKQLNEMMKDRFSILDEIKDIIGGDNIPLTLSIGVGFNGKSIETDYDLSVQAIDLALGRGGDQAVAKDGKSNYFFGGKSASVESTARVRARVKASSFKEIVETKDKVFIMGHTNQDLDSFGSSIGIYLMVTFLGKKAYIINNKLTQAVSEIKQKFLDSEQYPQDMFISGDKALQEITGDSVVVLVDHNIPFMSDDRRIVESELPIIMIDHHRMQDSTIKDAVMSYVDSSASSASELVVELIKFFDENLKLKPLEADAMLSGIMMDTLNFTYHASIKTFDSASYLRKYGADVSRVRKLLRIDKENEKIKNKVIEDCEYYRESFAIATLTEDCEDISVLASQIANELINIIGIKASIVIYPMNNGYYLSSRSIDEVNVQVLMENLGGGGHRSQAGAKIMTDNIEEAIEKLKFAIDDMIKNDMVKEKE